MDAILHLLPNGAGFTRRSGPRLRPWWSIFASAGAHFCALAALALLATAHALPTPQPRVIQVDLVPQQRPQPAPLPPVPLPQLSVPSPAKPVAVAPAAPSDDMTAATQLFAGGILNDPKNRDIRQTLPLLAPDERVVQLCDIEGLEQLRLALGGKTPDTLEPRAMGDPTITGTTLSAPGGAYRLSKQWYGVSFECTVAADRQSVAQFRFKLGAPIPREQGDSHNLTDEDVEMD